MYKLRHLKNRSRQTATYIYIYIYKMINYVKTSWEYKESKLKEKFGNGEMTAKNKYK